MFDLMQPERIPLFPLNVVLLPGAKLPLHIFEPRYRRMVSRCLQEKSCFGILLSSPEGVVRVGCTAEIAEVVRTYPGGRMDIVTVGRSPFRIVELFSGDDSAGPEDPLLEGLVDYLDDRERREDWGLSQELVELYETCHTLVFGDCPRELQTGAVESLAYFIADALPIDLLWKQQILELRCEADRRERLSSYLREWAPHLQNAKVMRHRAGGAGHGLN